MTKLSAVDAVHIVDRWMRENTKGLSWHARPVEFGIVRLDVEAPIVGETYAASRHISAAALHLAYRHGAMATAVEAMATDLARQAFLRPSGKSRGE